MVSGHNSPGQVLFGGTQLRVPFFKVQTIGNDFVLMEPHNLDYSALAQKVCDRRFGVGSDGLLIMEKGVRADVELRMFNPDGSEDFCGNGLRCAAMMANSWGWVHEEFTIHHLDRVLAAEVKDGAASVVLPSASFRASDVPVSTDLPDFIDQEVAGVVGTAVSTGTAHFIVFVDQLPGDEEFFTLSPRIEHDPRFPERTSIMWTLPKAADRLQLRIWERGVGETMGCGTGSSAAAAAWARREGRGGDIVVSNPGGDLRIHLDDWQSPIRATSRPVLSFRGELDL